MDNDWFDDVIGLPFGEGGFTQYFLLCNLKNDRMKVKTSERLFEKTYFKFTSDWW